MDELDQLFVPQQRALSLSKRALRLHPIVAHVPAASGVQPQPAVAVGHMGPLGDGLAHDIVHALIISLR